MDARKTMIQLRSIFLECVLASDSVSLTLALTLTLSAIAYNMMLVNYLSDYLSLYVILSVW